MYNSSLNVYTEKNKKMRNEEKKWMKESEWNYFNYNMNMKKWMKERNKEKLEHKNLLS